MDKQDGKMVDCSIVSPIRVSHDLFLFKMNLIMLNIIGKWSLFTL